MSFLIPEIFILLLCDLIFLAFLVFCLPFAADIALRWDMNSTDVKQYSLEKRGYLVSTAVRFIFYLKIPLFLLFIYANDKLSGVVTGAMCAAGVFNATVYGKYLLYAKILNIYLFALWLIIDKLDYKNGILPFTKLKFRLFIILFISFSVEILLFVLNFSLLDPTVPVSCCNTLFSEGQSVFLSLKGSHSLIIFSLSYAASAFFYFKVWHRAYGISAVIYFFTAALSLILFTSTYVYELPTHKCPFCILQSGYYYVGYAFYILLFIGTFSGAASLAVKTLTGKSDIKLIRTSFLANTAYYLLSICYPISYYLKNQTWL